MESAFGVDHGEISKSNPYLWGGQNAAAKDAPKGKKKQAYKDAMKVRMKAAGVGGGLGAAAGAGVGMASRGRVSPGLGAFVGGAGGAMGNMGASEGKAYRKAKEKGGW